MSRCMRGQALRLSHVARSALRGETGIGGRQVTKRLSGFDALDVCSTYDPGDNSLMQDQQKREELRWAMVERHGFAAVLSGGVPLPGECHAHTTPAHITRLSHVCRMSIAVSVRAYAHAGEWLHVNAFDVTNALVRPLNEVILSSFFTGLVYAECRPRPATSR